MATGRTFRVEQLGAPKGARDLQVNEAVVDLEDLVTHHPRANRHIQMRDGAVLGAEDQQPRYRGGDRSYAFVSGEFQETIDASTDRYGSLKPDQVLIVKDFILEDPAPPPGKRPREVGVPAPVGGIVSMVRQSGGMVEISDRQGGEVVARIRHLDPVSVQAGDTVEYGQSLGVQGNRGLPRTAGVHVHIEVDTRYYRQFEHYVEDLASGRLTVEAEYRRDVGARAVEEDGILRLGETSDRIATVQRALAADGYRATGDRPITIDGVYRLDMQGALLAFQQDHRIPQTGDVDPATVQVALRVNLDRPLGPLGLAPPAPVAAIEVLPSAMRELELGLDPRFTPRPGQPAPDAGHPADPARTRREPREHGHPFHDPAPMLERARTPDDPGHPDHALLERIRDGVRALDADAGKRWDADSERLSAGLLVRARAAGFDAGDALHVAASRPTDVAQGGEFVFLVRHGPTASPDPAANLARLRVTDALSTPVEQHYAQLECFEPQRDPAFAATRAPAVEPARHDAPGLG